MLSRRAFLRTSLQTSTLVALAPTVPGFLSQTARAAEIRHELVSQAMIQPRLSRFVSNSEPKAMNTVPETSSNEARCLRVAEANFCSGWPWPGS